MRPCLKLISFFIACSFLWLLCRRMFCALFYLGNGFNADADASFPSPFYRRMCRALPEKRVPCRWEMFFNGEPNKL